MATLNLSTTASGTGFFDHPALPGNAHGLVVITDLIPPIFDTSFNAVLSSQTNESLITLLTNNTIKTYLKGFVALPDGYTMDECVLNITTADGLAFRTYMNAYNAAVSVDVTRVNLYVTYTTTISKDDDVSYTRTITKVIRFVLEG